MIIDRQLSALKIVESAHMADVLLKTEDGHLKTEDILLKSKDGPSVNRRLLTCILRSVSTHTQTSKLDDYSKLSLWLSLKIREKFKDIEPYQPRQLDVPLLRKFSPVITEDAIKDMSTRYNSHRQTKVGTGRMSTSNNTHKK